MAEVPNLSFKTTDFVMGNGVAGVKVSPDVSGHLVDSCETCDILVEVSQCFAQ